MQVFSTWVFKGFFSGEVLVVHNVSNKWDCQYKVFFIVLNFHTLFLDITLNQAEIGNVTKFLLMLTIYCL